jgi:hypothetical protein
MPTTTLRLPTGSGSIRGPRDSRRHSGLGPILAVLVLGAGLVAGWAWWKGSVGSVTIRPHCTAKAAGSSHDLDPDQAGNAALIAGIAQRRGLPARAATIAIATAIQESKLRNLSYGDRDSVGLFQQRPSQGWGTRKQLTNPVYATNAFYDVLSSVDGYVNMPITDVAQKVQKSAFPNAYADHEPEARVIASALSGYSPAGFTCELRAPSGLSTQQPGAGGFTGRAAKLATAASREVGAASPRPGAGGRVLRYTTGGQRQAWALASWAVARGNALQVTKVAVGGHVWNRSKSSKGWQGGTGPGAGQVEITVA